MKDYRKRYLLRFYIRRLQVRLGLERRVIRWRAVKEIGPRRKKPPYNQAECFVHEDGSILFIFSLALLNTEEIIRRAVLHEFLHIYHDDEYSEELHQFIRRLERPLDRLLRRVEWVF